MANRPKRSSVLQRGNTDKQLPTTITRNPLKSRTINFTCLDSDVMEKLEPKDLFLCVQLVNNDNVIVKIGKKTTAKQALSRLRAYGEVKKLHPHSQALELVLSVCESLKLPSSPLPNYYKPYNLHERGFWTRPFEYAHCPLLTLKPAVATPDQDFKLPEVLQCSLDKLVDGGKAPNWSSNSREATAFRLKYPLNDVWEPKDTNASYPQFIDTLPDTLLDCKSHMVNILLTDLPLTNTSLLITATTTLREALVRLQEKVKKLVDAELDVRQKMLKVMGLCEYIWGWEVPLLQAEGIREALHTHQTPWLELVPRPSSMESSGCLPSFAIYDTVLPLVKEAIIAVIDNLDLTCFPVNDLALDDEDELRLLIHTRRTAQPSDIPSYVQKRSTVFRSTIFLPDPPKQRTQTMLPVLRKRISEQDCYSSLRDHKVDLGQDIDVRQLHKRFRLKVLGIDNLHMYLVDEDTGERKERLAVDRIKVEVALYHGSVRLEESHWTSSASSCKGSNGEFVETVRWNDWVSFRLKYSQVPQAAMIKFRVMGSVCKRPRDSAQERDLAWVNFRLFDFANRMESGIHRIGLYPYYSLQDPTGSTSTNKDPEASQLFIQLESFLKPVIFGESNDANFDLEGYLRELKAEIPSRDLGELSRIIDQDPLYDLKPEEKSLLWTYRAYVSQTIGLPKLLESVNWCSPECVRDAHFLLQFCPLQPPQVGLELLDGKFADVKIRDYAVRCLEQMNNFECSLYLLQLVQALKFEPYHDSALARFLMKRALKHPFTFGHTLFWLLRSEIEEPYFQERFGLLLEQFVRKCGPVHETLLFEDYLIKHLEQLAKTIARWGEEDKESLLPYLWAELDSINEEMPEHYPLAFNPKVRVSRIKVEECKIMKSKKKPLYLVFEGYETTEDVHVLFKTGDDLRQDLVVLTMLKIMQNLWAEQGMNLKLSLYHCMPLASGTGMLQIVQNAETLAAVHRTGGGQRGVFSKKTLKHWLMAKNTGEDWVDNFVKSCAGYSVGTYVLGVADRHNDNIMLKYSGQIFHIDYGHFLGYFKRKMGIPRETAPFVFTSDFRYAMGGKKSKGFRELKALCVNAYNVLRRNRRLFITLLCLMLCSGIPEITRKDIGFLLRTLPGDLSDEAAGKSFLGALDQALGSIMTKINFSIHLLAHKKSEA